MSHSQLEFQKPRTAGAALKIDADASAVISEELRRLLADVFALYIKTKNFHWHMSGPHFRDYHLLLDEQKGISSSR